MNFSQKKCCAECPFSRKVTPGAIGGPDPTVYIGQAMGPFFLPCHMDPKYEEDRASHDLIQCAGAATFRANIGVANRMPSILHHLPADRNMCFADPEELLMHHLRIGRELADAILRLTPPEILLRMEFAKLRPGMVKQL